MKPHKSKPHARAAPLHEISEWSESVQCLATNASLNRAQPEWPSQKPPARDALRPALTKSTAGRTHPSCLTPVTPIAIALFHIGPLPLQSHRQSQAKSRFKCIILWCCMRKSGTCDAKKKVKRERERGRRNEVCQDGRVSTASQMRDDDDDPVAGAPRVFRRTEDRTAQLFLNYSVGNGR